MATEGLTEAELREKLQGATVGYNPRFPNQNQTKHCWASYVEFQTCKAAGKEDEPQCQQFRSAYRSLCPEYWTEKWDEQVEAKRFPGQDIWDKSFARKTHH